MGQFVIAVCQGVAGAASIYIAGFHQGFFLFAVLLSALSVIPLGSGIITIPFGIGMILFGNVFGGVFVIVFHLIVVTNIDNFLRPILVPRAARLDSALMLLAVFAGIAMFGAWGIVIGPVLMIIIVTTISVYLAVYKGVPMDQPDPKDDETQAAKPVRVVGPPHQACPRRSRRQARRRRPRLRQTLSEEFDDALARLVGRMPVDLAHLQGQHRVRHLAETVLVALLRADLDHLERVAEPVLEGLEPSPGDSGSSLNRKPSAHSPSLAARCSTIFSSASDSPGSRSLLRRQPYRQRRLAQHRRQHAVVDGGREREAAGEHWPITPTPLPGVFSLRSRASARR